MNEKMLKNVVGILDTSEVVRTDVSGLDLPISMWKLKSFT